ncbi:MAG: hypothetical protein R3B90_06025 [Planctomycetaceae bacterium]
MASDICLKASPCGSALLLAVVWTLTGLVPACVSAQQVTIGVTQQNFSDDFYEYVGRRPGPFGGGQLGDGITYGPGFGAGAGRSTVFTSETPFLTVTNGIPGTIFIGRATPFVTGIVPVFGNGSVGFNPTFNNLGAANTLSGRMQRGEFHVVDGQVRPGPAPGQWLAPELASWPELQPRQAVGPKELMAAEAQWLLDEPPAEPMVIDAVDTASKQDSAARDLLAKGDQLLAEGKAGAAKLLWGTALNKATGPLRSEIEARLAGLSQASDKLGDTRDNRNDE